MSVLALFCFLTIVSVVRSDLYGCNQETSCKTCIKQYVSFYIKKLTCLLLTLCSNPCGWCETNILYEDGTMGPQCAGKPQDPKNPPKDYKPCKFSYSCLNLSETYCFFRDLPIKLSKFVLPFLSLQQQDLPMR